MAPSFCLQRAPFIQWDNLGSFNCTIEVLQLQLSPVATTPHPDWFMDTLVFCVWPQTTPGGECHLRGNERAAQPRFSSMVLALSNSPFSLQIAVIGPLGWLSWYMQPLLEDQDVVGDHSSLKPLSASKHLSASPSHSGIHLTGPWQVKITISRVFWVPVILKSPDGLPA